MTTTVFQWEVSSRVTLSPLRAIWLASTVTAVFVVTSLNFDNTKINYLFLISTICLYVLVNSVVFIKYFVYKNQSRVILIRDGILYVPRFVLRDYEIKISDIRSMERYANHKENLGLLIGRLNKGSVFVDKRFFSSAVDFDGFIKAMDHFVSMNRKGDGCDTIDELIRRQGVTSHLPIAAIALMLTVIYLISSGRGFESISNSFLVEGCLNKVTMQPNEFYRIGSSFILHSSPWHLGLNILCFAVIGRNLLVLLGSQRFFNILFLSGVCGALASLAFSKYDSVIGASGGILGLFGAYTCVWMKHHKELPGSVSIPARRLCFILLLQFGFDAIEPGIDVSSHIAGFIFGFLYAAWVLRGKSLVYAVEPCRAERVIAILVGLFFIYSIQHFFRLVLLTSVF